jgi:two-component system cell cycle response regulator
MTRRGKILVVDDDDAVRLRIRDILEAGETCSVEEAVNGAACLAAVARRAPDLILLDLMMPGLNGLEVCSRLRADPRTREIPIIILSAANEETALPAALEAGAEDYLSKPVPSRELRAKVKNILRLDRYQGLRQERDRLRWLFEHSCEAVVRISRAGDLIEANRRAREIFGFPETVAPDETAPDALAILALKHRADPADAFARLRERRPFADGAFSLHRPESRLLASHWYRVEVHEDTDAPSSDVLLKLTEQSERVRLELESWSFQQLIAHKLRTPINGVGALLDLLIDDPSCLAGEEARDLALSARECATRLERTLLSIMRYHQVVCGLAADSASGGALPWDQLLREAAAEAGLAPGRLRITGDPAPLLAENLVEPLRMVLAELTGNYLKFAEAAQGGMDARFVTLSGPVPVLRLFAPGPVLAPELVARLGRPYWQVERRFTGEVPGVGLGLATCRLLLSSLGGDLVLAASEAPPGLISTVILPSSR